MSRVQWLGRTVGREARVGRFLKPARVGAAVGLMCVALVARSRAAGTDPWIDEAISLGIARRPILEIPGALSRDGSPPLYYVVLHLWASLGTWSHQWADQLSTVGALAAVPVAWWSGNRLESRRAGWIMATLVAALPFLAVFSTETRMYTWLFTGALVTTTLWIDLLSAPHSASRSPRRAIAAGVALGALLLLHNWAWYLAFALAGAAVLAVARTRQPRGPLTAAVTTAAIAVWWLPTLLAQLGTTAAPWSIAPSSADIYSGLGSVFGQPLALTLLAGFATLGLLTPRDHDPRPHARATTVSPVMLLLVINALTLLAVVIANTLVAQWATRYLALVTAPTAMALAVGLSRLGTGGTLVSLVVATAWLNPLGAEKWPRWAKSNATVAIDTLAPALQQTRLVLVAQPELGPLVHELLPDLQLVTPLGQPTEPQTVDWRNAVDRMRVDPDPYLDDALAQLARGDRILFVGLPGGEAVGGPRWGQLISASSTRWRAALDARLIRVGEETTPLGAWAPVRAVLYEAP